MTNEIREATKKFFLKKIYQDKYKDMINEYFNRTIAEDDFEAIEQWILEYEPCFDKGDIILWDSIK